MTPCAVQQTMTSNWTPAVKTLGLPMIPPATLDDRRACLWISAGYAPSGRLGLDRTGQIHHRRHIAERPHPDR